MVEEDSEGSSVDVQGPRGDGGGQAHVRRGLQTQPVHRPGFRLLRMEGDAGRHATVLHLGSRRLGAFVCRPMGRVASRRNWQS